MMESMKSEKNAVVSQYAGGTAIEESGMDVLLQSIQNRTGQVGVVGLGYVGLPLAMLFARAGFPVTGFDVDITKVNKLNAGSSYIQRILPEEIAQLRETGFKASAEYADVSHMQAIIICVPTPLDEHQGPDLRFIEDTARSLVAASSCRTACHSGKHHLSGNHGRSLDSIAGSGQSAGTALLSRRS